MLFRSALLSYMQDEHGELLKTINETGAYDEKVETGLRQALESFQATQSW